MAGEFYRHFKGNLYQVIGVAYDAETMRQMVVYWALNGNRCWYVRSLEEFLSPVDREKYPDTTARYRFERVVLEEILDGDAAASAGAKVLPAFRVETMEHANVEMREIKKDGSVSAQAASFAGEEPAPEWDNPDAEKVRPELLRFLDAETPAQKLSVLREIRGKLDEELMTSIELSIDLMPDDKETLERRLSLVENNLEKRVRYEGGRLR